MPVETLQHGIIDTLQPPQILQQEGGVDMFFIFRLLGSIGLKVAAHYLVKKMTSWIDGWL